MKISKTFLIALLTTTLMSVSAMAQKGQSSNCVAQGTVIIDAFYGYPYFNGVLLKGVSTNTTVHVHNTNHIGGKVEYLVSDKIGMGLEFTYANAFADYQDSAFHTYRAGVNKMRILGKMNFHFATTSTIDPYFTIGAGYKKTTFTDNSPNGTDLSFNVIPVAFRVGVGMHYYFTDFMGINAEVGLGGPIMQGGLSFKF